MLYRLFVFLHLLGVFGFLLAHGVSVWVGLRLRRERDPVRIRGLLELSRETAPAFRASVALLLVGGVVAGFLGHWWDQGWIWASLGLFVALMAGLGGVAVPYYRRVRVALEGRSEGGGGPAELDRILRAPHPVVLLWVGMVSLVVLLWLMVFKPF